MSLAYRSLNRRRFLQGLAVGTGAFAFSGVNSAFSGENDNLILGTGKHRYEWIRGWGKLPEDKKYGSMHGDVVVDSQNHIIFSTDGEYPFVVFDQDGKFVRSFGAEFKPDRDGNGTHGMQIYQEGKDEFIYITSLFRAEAAKITTKGEIVWTVGYPEQSGIYKEKKEYRPTCCTVASNGHFYVTDGYGANYVHHYNAKSEYVNSWGGKGKEDGKFATPHKAIIDKRGPQPLILVTDRANHRLQWFDLDGKHVKTLDGTENDFLRLPSSLNFRDNELVIGDLRGRLTILDKDNKLITHLGDSGDPKKQGSNRITRDQWVDGQFIAPHGATWDRQGNLFVSEWSLDGRLEKLKRLA